MINTIMECYPDEEFLKADGFDDAIIGLEQMSNRLIYSYTKCIDILCQEMGEEEAVEYFEYNVVNAYVGEKTPIWCYDTFE
jgi:hypothetical protein